MSVQHANKGIIRDNLVLYYDTKFENSFRGEATTNLITQTDFSNWSVWFGSPTVTPFVLAPDYNYAYKILDDSAISYEGIQLTSISVAPSGSYSFGGWFAINEDATSTTVYRLRATSTSNFLSLFFNNISGAVTLENTFDGGSPASVSSYGVSETKVYNGYVWKRIYVTFTMPASVSSVGVELLPAPRNTSGGGDSVTNVGYTIAWGPQLEEKLYPTPFINGSRTNLVSGGGGFLDISKISKEDVDTDNIEYDSSGPYVSSLNKYVWFGGSNPYLENLTDDGNSHTFECWWAPLGTPPGANDGYFCGRRGFHLGHRQSKANGLQHNCILWYASTSLSVGSIYTYPSYGVWGHLCYVVDEVNNIARYYVNGNQQGANATITAALRNYGTGDYHLFSGSGTNWSGNGRLGTVRFYNKALSAPEVLQNYNAQKHLYGH
jgi:hypothetical protein